MTNWKRLLATLAFVASPALMGDMAAQAQSQQVNLYTSLAQPTIDALRAAFAVDHPEIEVVPLRLVTGQLATRFYNEASAGLNEADILMIATSELFDKYPELFGDLSGIAGYDAWPEALKTPVQVRSNFGPLWIYYNTDLVKAEDVPTGWESLLNPAFKGKITMVDPGAAPTFMSWLLTMRNAFGDDFVRGLGGQDIRLVGGGLDAAQAVASGAADIGIPLGIDFSVALIAQGAPLAVVNAGSPTVTNQTSVGIAANAPHPEAAKTFLDWFLSDGGQAIMCKFYQRSGSPDMASCPDKLPADFVPPTFGISEETAAELMSLMGR